MKNNNSLIKIVSLLFIYILSHFFNWIAYADIVWKNIGMNIGVNKILDNVDDKVFISKLYYNNQNEKYIIVVTKNYKWAYKLNYLYYSPSIDNFIIRKSYSLVNKNFYKNNLFIFDNDFLYIESSNNGFVYFYDKLRRYKIAESTINKYFWNGLRQTDQNNNIIPWTPIYWMVLHDKNSYYAFQTINNVKNFLSWNTVFLWNARKNFPFIYSNWVFYFYNISMSKVSRVDQNIGYVFDKSVSDFWYKSVLCPSPTPNSNITWKHNYLLQFNLFTGKASVIGLQNRVSWKRVCYYNTQNVSLSSKNLFSCLNNRKGLLLTQNRDSNNNDNFLNVYKLDLSYKWIFATKIFQTKIMDNVVLDHSIVLNDKNKQTFYNSRKYTNMYEDKAFQVFYYRKNQYNTLLIYNKKTWKITEFKDILILKKIVSNMFNGHRSIEIVYEQKLWWIEKIKITKILDTDQVLNEWTMNKNSKIKYIYTWIFDNILTIVNRNYLYYKFLWYYNIIWKLIFSKNDKFFMDYKKDIKRFNYLVINKKNYTTILNQALAKYDQQWLTVQRLWNLKLLDDWDLLFNFTYTKKVIVKKQKYDNKLKKMVEVNDTKEIKGNKNLLFNLNKVIALPDNPSALQYIYSFPIYNKIFLWYKWSIYIGSTVTWKFDKINILDNSLISTLWFGVSWESLLWEKKDYVSKPIVDYKNGNLYVITKNSVHSINTSNWKVKKIIDWNIQKIYNYNWHMIIYNIDNHWINNLYIDYKKLLNWNFLGMKIYDNILFLFNKKSLQIVVIDKILNYKKVMKFNSIIDKYILNLDNPVMLYYYNLFKDVIYRLNNKNADKNIIMNLFYKYYLDSKK